MRLHSQLQQCRRHFFKSSIQESTGSLARDLLANERTFLAWSRTGLGFVGLGIALQTVGIQMLLQNNSLDSAFLLEQEKRLNVSSLLFFTTGGVFLGYAVRRYIYVTRLLQQGKMCTGVHGALLISGVCTLTALGGIYLVCTGNHAGSMWNLLPPQDDEVGGDVFE